MSIEADTGQEGAWRGSQGSLPFTLAFQPIVDLAARRIAGHEALMRGRNGEGAGWVLSQVPAAGLHGFDRAFHVSALDFVARLGMPGRLHVNVMSHHTAQPGPSMRPVLDALDRTGIDPARITFELVDTGTAAEQAHLRRVVREYRHQGFKIALNDVTAGHSGLWRLAELEPDCIKIGRAIIRGCDQDHKRLAIIAGLNAMGRAMGTGVVACGVERASEAEALLASGVGLMQGFLFSRPIDQDFCHPASVFGPDQVKCG